MTDFPARIKPKKSSVSGEVPSAADLEVAEIAVNTADGKLFVKHTDDSIKEISGAGGGGGGSDVQYTRDLDDVVNVVAAEGQVLQWRAADAAPPEVLTRLEFDGSTVTDNVADPGAWAYEPGDFSPSAALYVQESPNDDAEWSIRFPKTRTTICITQTVVPPMSITS